MNELNRENKLSIADLAAATRRPESADRPAPAEPAPEKPLREERPREVPVGREASERPAEQPALEAGPLFVREEADQFRADWDAIQIAFVDEPRRSVERADELVARTIQRLADVFAQERAKLEEQWGRGDEVSTEDLRVALQRYRSFFGRLLAV